MGVCGSQLARERKEFYTKQLQDKDEIISELKEKTKTLEEEKQKMNEKNVSLKQSEIRKDMELKKMNEQLEQLRSENEDLTAEIKKSPSIPDSIGNLAKKTGQFVGKLWPFK